jgi:hypothetical protein
LLWDCWESFFKNISNWEHCIDIVHKCLGHLIGEEIAEAGAPCDTAHLTAWVTLVVWRSNHFERTLAPMLTGFVTTKFIYMTLPTTVTHAIRMNWKLTYLTLLPTFHPWHCRQRLRTCLLVLSYVCNMLVHSFRIVYDKVLKFC